MSREIKFRGRIAQGLENAGAWVYWGISGTDMLDALDSDTIGEFTGITDKNGAPIYEGDIVKTKLTTIKAPRRTEGHIGKVFFSEFEWCIETNDSYWPVASWACVEQAEVIGNIYENPDLLNNNQ